MLLSLFSSVQGISCVEMSDPYKQWHCFSNTLRSAEEGAQSVFMKCIVNCDSLDPEEKSKCAKECMSSGNPTEIVEHCIIGCTNLSPIDQSQCFDNCRKTHRLSLNSDFSDSFQRCKRFHNFFKNVHQTKDDFRDAMEKVCANDINMISICQGIAMNTFEKTYLLLNTTSSAKSFCLKMGYAGN